MTYQVDVYTLEDLDEAFALLTPEQVDYALSQGITLDKRLAYVDTHWLYKDEPEDRRFQMAVGECVSWYRSIANDTYGLRD